tara:strand:- start:543 stop:806 length:264 start_codon:yes stop_codon:yes gene_type:complete
MIWFDVLKMPVRLEHKQHRRIKELVDSITKDKESFSAREIFEALLDAKPAGSSFRDITKDTIFRYFNVSPNYEKNNTPGELLTWRVK